MFPEENVDRNREKEEKAGEAYSGPKKKETQKPAGIFGFHKETAAAKHQSGQKTENKYKVDIGIQDGEQAVDQQKSCVLKISHKLSGQRALPFVNSYLFYYSIHRGFR